MPKLETDIATIKESLRYIQRDVGEMKATLCGADDRITKNENSITAIQTKLGILSVFQVAFSTVVGAIATFLASK